MKANHYPVVSQCLFDSGLLRVEEKPLTYRIILRLYGLKGVWLVFKLKHSKAARDMRRIIKKLVAEGK